MILRGFCGLLSRGTSSFSEMVRWTRDLNMLGIRGRHRNGLRRT